jgi:hypothetical protein
MRGLELAIFIGSNEFPDLGIRDHDRSDHLRTRSL